MSVRGVLLIGIVLNTLYSGIFCDLGNAARIAACVRKSLESDRKTLKTQVVPLELNRAFGTLIAGELDWFVSSYPTVRGLGNYSFEGLDMDIEKGGAIRIKSNITWPSITIDATGLFWLYRPDNDSDWHELISS